LTKKNVYDVMYRVNFAIFVNSISGNRYFDWFYDKGRNKFRSGTSGPHYSTRQR